MVLKKSYSFFYGSSEEKKQNIMGSSSSSSSNCCGHCGRNHKTLVETKECRTQTRQTMLCLRLVSFPDEIVIMLSHFFDGCDVRNIGWTSHALRRILYKLDIHPLGRLHQLLIDRGLGRLPAFCRTQPKTRIIGGIVLMAIMRTVPSDPHWLKTDVDITVPLDKFESTIANIELILVHSKCNDVKLNLVRSKIDAHCTMSYRYKTSNYKIDILARPKDKLVMDIACLDNDYDGQVLSIQNPQYIYEREEKECLYRPQSSAIIHHSWARILKYRERGFCILPTVANFATFTMTKDYRNSDKRVYTLEEIDSYTRVINQGELPFVAGIPITNEEMQESICC